MMPQGEIRIVSGSAGSASVKGSSLPLDIASAILPRLKNTSGFMLAEQMVSILFIGLLCIAISVGLGAALSAYGTVNEQVNAQQLLSDSIQNVNDELKYSLSVGGDDGNAFVSANMNTNVKLVAADSKILLREADGTKTIAVLASTTKGLAPTFLTVPTYESQSNTWSYEVAIEDSHGNTVARQAITVLRANVAADTVTPAAGG